MFGDMTHITTEWVVGFVDGEGCFHIGMFRHPTLTLGTQILPEFTVTQHRRNVHVLYALKSHFQCGVVRPQRDSVWIYRVRAHHHLRDIIVPYFERHVLRTRKRVDFLRFRRVVLWMSRGLHLTPQGLARIQHYVLSRR